MSVLPDSSLQSLGKSLRAEFPVFEKHQRVSPSAGQGETLPLVYLDTAATAQKPLVVLRAMHSFLENDYGTVHRGAYELSISASQRYEEARTAVAKFIGQGVSRENIIFTRGTTESLNIVAQGLAQDFLTPDCRIVLPAIEHHANLVPWQQAALRSGCEIAYIPMEKPLEGRLGLDLDKARKLINSRTKIVTLAYVGNVLGQVNPVAEIVNMAKEVGALVVLDCAQSAASFGTNPFDWGVDAIAFSGHKLYGPTGIGVLALSERLMKILPPLLYGGGMISDVTLEGSQWTSGPAKFEAGTPPIAEAFGLQKALEWLSSLGRERVHAHVSALATAFRVGLAAFPEIDVFSPATGQESVVSFRHKSLHAHDLATLLDSFNVAMRAGHHCAWPLIRSLRVDALVRASFGVYSDFDDVEIALSAIKRAGRMF
jgi:cysteine desulfurase / selenocysteine lyase